MESFDPGKQWELTEDQAVHLNKHMSKQVTNVLGLIFIMWITLEADTDRKDASKWHARWLWSNISLLVDKTELFITECFTDISCQRRAKLNRLMTNQTEVKEILKIESEALDNQGNSKLFGPSFNETLAKISFNFHIKLQDQW